MIVLCKEVHSSEFCKDTSCNICFIVVKVSNVNERVKEIVNLISDNSWLKSLHPIENVTFAARSKRTIKKLVEDILLKSDGPISEDLGEYIISCTAQDILEADKNHKKVPLAELLKEKVTGNPGFDFHTETDTQVISFGEAKYNSRANSYGKALSQIAKFIELEKDKAEFSILKHFVSEAAIQNALNGTTAYCAAFSLHSSNHELIISNIKKSDDLKQLLGNSELYIIGVEISA